VGVADHAEESQEMTRRIFAFAVALAVVAFVRSGATAAAGFELREREHIVIIGNTLAERMQQDGWLETLLHARFSKHQLVVRNLGFSGDEIATRMRSKNFGTPDEWLSAKAAPIGGYQENRLAGIETRADVIFAFFGYNESHAGKAGLDAFRRQLTDWIKHTLAQRYNGKTAPRLVLFSPIAHEDLKDPDLPDGRRNNERLELYTRAMADVAKAHGVFFVDLFTPSRQLYAKAPAPLTINGIHLTADGNRRIAEAIDSALFGEVPRHDESYLARLRQIVVDKDFHWFNRYRVTDGYSTYGDRAFLHFVRGIPSNVGRDVLAKTPKENVLPTNYEVLQRELPLLDVMTANRDRRIWAVASGTAAPGDPNIDDFTTASLIDPETNFPKTPMFLSGEESLTKMTVGKGLKVEVFASEKEFPELVNPVQMAFDTRGRLWVAAWKTYPHWQPTTPMDDKLLILEDTNGDGKADKRSIFAGDLHNPTGFEFYNGGVIVAQAPNLLFLKDTDGDDRYDVKQTILHGFDTADTHHTINSFTFDPGGALYTREGVFHRTQIETPWGAPVRLADGGVFRFEPRTWKLEVYAPMNFPNPHGHVFDAWGRDIIFDATGGQPYYGPSMSTKKYYPDMESEAPSPGRVRTRPVGGTDILSSRHFPDELQGNLIILNVIGFRGLLNYRLSEDGAGLKITEGEPVLQSADENFRPVDAEVGPDGALYFVDWHNPIIGHMQHNLRDTTRDKVHGRVYRVTYPGRPLLKPAPIAGAPTPQLLDLLKEPEDRVRYRAKIELSARDTVDVLREVQAWIDRLDAGDRNHEHHLMEALWVHQWHNRVNEPLLRRMLQSAEPRARAAATRVLCYWRDRVANPLALLKTLVNDAHPAVRLEAVRTASFFQTADAAAVALEALNHPQDRFIAHTLEQTMATLTRFLPRKILTTASPRAIEYQLGRLSNAELVQVERTVSAKDRAVYAEMLTRRGLGREHFDEAMGALAKIDKSTPTRVLLDALPRVPVDDVEAGDRLVRVLLMQPPETLKKERDALAKTIASGGSALALRAAYGALMIAEGSPQAVWERVPDRADHRAAALEALAEIRQDAATFRLLAQEVRRGSELAPSAVRSLLRLPRKSWPQEEVEPLVRAIVANLAKTRAESRTGAPGAQARQLAEKLADALPDEARRAVRRDLRAVGVQVVRIEAVPEQMMFDVRWFAVEANKPVQIVFVNPDAMPHNLLITKPGALKEVGTAASAMAPPTDPGARAFVPDTPLVLEATRLLNWGETARLNFTAPSEPGEYPFVCTFPGHWVRMYGVMLVVDNLETWETTRTPPKDPMTNQPYSSQR
jgi:glucose/arabinose dehydrogenase/azurin/lysophospholipase L1-like esterase